MGEDLKLTTWGVKVTDEVKEKIKNVMESSGLQGKEFIESMLELFEANLIKNKQPILAQEITELETITRRIVSMYIGIGDRMKTMLDDKERQYQSAQEQEKETIKLLHSKIKGIEEERNALLETNLRLQQELDELKNQNISIQQIIELLKRMQHPN